MAQLAQPSARRHDDDVERRSPRCPRMDTPFAEPSSFPPPQPDRTKAVTVSDLVREPSPTAPLPGVGQLDWGVSRAKP